MVVVAVAVVFGAGARVAVAAAVTAGGGAGAHNRRDCASRSARWLREYRVAAAPARAKTGTLYGPRTLAQPAMPLIRHSYPTPLGEMVALLSDAGLCLLEFSEGTHGLQAECAQVEAARGGPARPGASALSARVGEQLAEYFAGRRRRFELPLDLVGTPFQLEAWRALLEIPYGRTRSYAEQARQIGRPSAVRAVAAANGRNKVSVVVPCHRVIGSDGSLTGYGGGIDRKRWLLALEHDGAPPAASFG